MCWQGFHGLSVRKHQNYQQVGIRRQNGHFEGMVVPELSERVSLGYLAVKIAEQLYL